MADDYLVRLIQKRLVDPTYKINAEDVYKAETSLNQRIEIATLYLNSLMTEAKLIEKFVVELRHEEISRQHNS
jgi:hypothetical protein